MSTIQPLHLVVDMGNTCTKFALFRGEYMLESYVDYDHSLSRLSELCRLFPIDRGILSTVVQLGEEQLARLVDLPFPLLRLDHTTPLPIKNLYRTPQTLGSDRLAAVVGAQSRFPEHDLLVIDAGSCITYEFLDASGCYHGGNISPGLQMRLSALHQLTSRLPVVDASGPLPTIGYDTETAIRAGVVKGIEYEMSGYITSLRQKYPGLLVFLTGGDRFSFDANIKSIIFADRFLVLKGLNRILSYNK